MWEMHREALRTYKGVFEHKGVLGASGDIRGCLNAWGHPNIWESRCPQSYGGVNSMPPSVELICH